MMLALLLSTAQLFKQPRCKIPHVPTLSNLSIRSATQRATASSILRSRSRCSF